MKYIVLHIVTKMGLDMEVPFMFPEILVHSMVAEECTVMLKKHFGESDIKAVSAGFFNSQEFDSDFSTYGKSETLGLESRKGDAELLQMCDYGSMYAQGS